MEKKSQVDDNVSLSDRISHGLASSISENKPSIQNPRDADGSTVSSERVHSSENCSIRSDVGSGTEKTFSGKRRKPDTGRGIEVTQADSTMVPFPHKQLKAESSSSKQSAVVAQLSSVGSVALNLAQPLSSSGFSHPTQSDESKNVFQEPESSVTVKSEVIIASVRSSRFEFDLNEGLEDIEPECHPTFIRESNSSQDALHLGPIPVVAKVGVPAGLPKKPLQFDGELGWRRLGIASAFRPTLSKSPDIEKVTGGNLKECGSKAPLCREFDLNIAATVDLEVAVNQTPVDVFFQKPERVHYNGRSITKNFHKPGTAAIDLNDNPTMDYACRNLHRQGEAQLVSRNCTAIDTATCSGGTATQFVSDSRRSPYWVDLSSVQGYGHVQGQPLLMGAPAAEQVQMMVPIQLSHTPTGVYFGKINGLTPTFYPPNVLPSLINHQGIAAIPQISGPVLATYPGNVHLLENSQGLSPHTYSNMRQTILSNGSVALVGNGSRGLKSAELLVPARNSFIEEPMKAEQTSFTTSSMKRREPDTGWGSSQINCRQMASWN